MIVDKIFSYIIGPMLGKAVTNAFIGWIVGLIKGECMTREKKNKLLQGELNHHLRQ